MSTIKNIYKFIDYKGVSVNEFSKKVLVSNGYFAKQRGSNGAISSNILEKIVIEYSDINPDWLLTGRGEMLRENAKKEVKEPVSVEKNTDCEKKLTEKEQQITKLLDQLSESQKQVSKLLEQQEKLLSRL